MNRSRLLSYGCLSTVAVLALAQTAGCAERSLKPYGNGHGGGGAGATSTTASMGGAMSATSGTASSPASSGTTTGLSSSGTNTSSTATSTSTTSTGSITTSSTTTSSSSTTGSGCPGGCNSPPSGCYAQSGACVAGACQYAFIEGASCDDGNACTVADTCTMGSCVGTPKVCNAPPATVCVSGTTLRTYDTNGSCTSGVCVYQKHDITCSGGPCVNNACQTDPCANITCNNPPSSCFGAAGTCTNGSCSYPFQNGIVCDDGNACTVNDSCNAGVCSGAPKVCNTPPPSVCNGSSLESYAAMGTCSAGTCGYSATLTSCAAGCANGHCNASGWSTLTSNTTNNLWSVWGPSANAVWAVGDFGTADFYNGANWQLRSPPTPETLLSVHGTASNNVFTVTRSGKVFKWNGSSWALHTQLSSSYDYAGIFVDGVDSLWIGAGYTGGATTSLFRSVSGAVTFVGSLPESFNSPDGGASLWASSPTDVWVAISGGHPAHYDGMALTHPTTAISGAAVWGSSATDIFIGSSSNAGIIYEGSGSSFTSFSDGMNGFITAISGTSSSRVFGSVRLFGSGGAIFFYDGVGVTQETLPAGTAALEGIWAASTGEVFAVGRNGTILRGP